MSFRHRASPSEVPPPSPQAAETLELYGRDAVEPIVGAAVFDTLKRREALSTFNVLNVLIGWRLQDRIAESVIHSVGLAMSLSHGANEPDALDVVLQLTDTIACGLLDVDQPGKLDRQADCERSIERFEPLTVCAALGIAATAILPEVRGIRPTRLLNTLEAMVNAELISLDVHQKATMLIR